MAGSDSLIRGLFHYNQDMHATSFSGRLLAQEEWSNLRPGAGGEKQGNFSIILS